MSRTHRRQNHHTPTQRSGEPHSQRKKLAFSVILGLIPVLLVAALETLLRLISYDGNLDVVTRKDLGDRTLLTVNRSVAKRYFAQSGVDIPEPQDDAFEVAKPAGTKRVFCLGESTMQGFPYEYNATAPSFLRDRLESQIPGTRCEVINVGLSAVGSYVVRDFLAELLNYQPDLFVIYVGHNEFYGAYGPGSAVAIKGPAWLTRASLRLLRFKTYLLARDVYTWVAEKLTAKPSARETTMMGQMVGNAEIPYGSPIYREALATYVANIREMIALARQHHVPVLFSTVVSNINDRPPFISVFSPATSAEQRVRWGLLEAGGDSLMSAGNTEGAAGSFREATAIDSTNASGFYRLGKALAAGGLYDEAFRALTRAKDLDALRFRASEEFNSALLTVCGEEGAAVSRIDSAFAAASPHGLPGHELILEHLHPNIGGYFLMAKTWAHDIRADGLMGPGAEWREAPPDTVLFERSTVSLFDEEVGRRRIDVLLHHWPFVARETSPKLIPADSVQAIVFSYIQRRMTWAEARYALGELYARRGEPDNARREILAVAHANPLSCVPLLRVGDFFYLQGRQPEAEEQYRQSIAVEDNQYGRIKLGALYLDDGRPAEAAAEIERAFALEAMSRIKFPLHGAATGRFNLGTAYARMGKNAEARAQLQRAQAIEPGMKGPRELLEQLNQETHP
jgi:tetratricopeptide (TPR) repeat protein